MSNSAYSKSLNSFNLAHRKKIVLNKKRVRDECVHFGLGPPGAHGNVALTSVLMFLTLKNSSNFFACFFKSSLYVFNLSISSFSA